MHLFSAADESDIIFSIFGLDVTGQVTTMWGIMLILVVLSIIATRNLKDKPGVLQNVTEMAVERLYKFFEGVLGPKKTGQYFPLFGTLFIFVLCSNYSGLIPGSGLFKGFIAPTSSLSVTAALAIIVFICTHFFGFKTNGFLGYLKHFISPMIFMLPFLIIEELVHPLSLALRLYGNIFGEESVTEQLYNMFPVILPLVMVILSLLFCLIQAVVFSMLAAMYVEEATEKAARPKKKKKKPVTPVESAQQTTA